jgi:hypothetical protein
MSHYPEKKLFFILDFYVVREARQKTRKVWQCSNRHGMAELNLGAVQL